MVSVGPSLEYLFYQNDFFLINIFLNDILNNLVNSTDTVETSADKGKLDSSKKWLMNYVSVFLVPAVLRL